MTKKELYEKYLSNLPAKAQIEIYQRPDELIEYIERQHKKLYPNEKINSQEVAKQIWEYMGE